MSSSSTRHQLTHGDARNLPLDDGTVHCVVTSPPYPMIEMWDACFTELNSAAGEALAAQAGEQACELMHEELDRAWQEVHRVLVDGGIACINIGDATRKIGGSFRLFVNHARILQYCIGLGFQALPAIIWRKQTNAPNKFMGSGMLPPGAYVTLEHEYILLLRKGAKREFRTPEARANRNASAYFWEERNQWFSDVWYDLKGTSQKLKGAARDRSAAFPLELAYRLINMFSVKGDTVLDPFGGIGTTALAAAASQRNSVVVELDAALLADAGVRLAQASDELNACIAQRLARHIAFVQDRLASGKTVSKTNLPHDLPCISGQESTLGLRAVTGIRRQPDNCLTVSYGERPLGTPQETIAEVTSERAELPSA